MVSLSDTGQMPVQPLFSVDIAAVVIKDHVKCPSVYYIKFLRVLCDMVLVSNPFVTEFEGSLIL